ncbi:MAG TPA: LacI family DNA-binding transcriptional regulator [Paenirhodobacter sp.]
MDAERPASMQDIADALGVSRATVSNALSGTGRLSAETARLIRDKAVELNFAPSGVGRALRTGRSATIALVLPDFRMPLFAEFARAFAMAAQRREMALMVADSLGDMAIQTRHMLDLSARGIDALIVLPMRGSRLEDVPVSRPLIVLDAETNPMNTVSADHRAGGRLIARHLACLGHRDVLILNAPGAPNGAEASRVNDTRMAGMTEIFTASGVTMRPVSLPARFENARDFIAGWSPGNTTAIAATYDALAVGALTALTARGIVVPRDISVTGFDDTIWGRIVTPDLTTVRQDLDALAEHALAYAMGEEEHARLIPVSLVPRGSTARPLASAPS